MVCRPYKYQRHYPEMLRSHLAQGYSYSSFAGKIGVTRENLYRWEKRHPEWLNAKSIGLAAGLLIWEKMGVRFTEGEEKGNHRIWVLTMKNRFGWNCQN